MLRTLKMYLLLTAATVISLCNAAPVVAIPSLNYTVQDLGGGNWSYHYTINNDLVGQAIDSFTIDFAYGLYLGLNLDATPIGWGSSYLAGPNFTSTGATPGTLYGFADEGFEIAPGASLSGFSVSFIWSLLDTDSIGNFISLPLADGVLADGDQASTFTTIPADPPALVPEPSIIALLGLGLVALASYRMISLKRKIFSPKKAPVKGSRGSK